MKTHKLKILAPFADKITSGEKTFEVRRNDRAFESGDLLEFEAINENTLEPEPHPINCQRYRVGYILRFEDFPAGLAEGFAVLAITPEAGETEEYKRGYKEAAMLCEELVDAEAWAYCDFCIRYMRDGDQQRAEGASALSSNIRERIKEDILKEGET